MDLAELQKEAYAIAKSKGWHDRDDEVTFGDRIALVHSELSEALEAYREHGLEPWGLYPYIDTPYDEPPPKPEGVSYKLADVVIRVADMAEHAGFTLDEEPPEWTPHFKPETLGDWIALGHWLLSDVLDSAYTDDIFVTRMLSATVDWIRRMAARYGIDLDAAIEVKMEYNRTREYRHGGKSL